MNIWASFTGPLWWVFQVYARGSQLRKSQSPRCPITFIYFLFQNWACLSHKNRNLRELLVMGSNGNWVSYCLFSGTVMEQYHTESWYDCIDTDKLSITTSAIIMTRYHRLPQQRTLWVIATKVTQSNNAHTLWSLATTTPPLQKTANRTRCDRGRKQRVDESRLFHQYIYVYSCTLHIQWICSMYMLMHGRYTYIYIYYTYIFTYIRSIFDAN